MFRRLRVKHAARWGRREHKFGRYQFIPVIIGLVYSIYMKDNVYAYIFATTLICQSIYLVSHTIEKKLYGNYGSRSWGK